jgi:hypothetical protein
MLQMTFIMDQLSYREQELEALEDDVGVAMLRAEQVPFVHIPTCGPSLHCRSSNRCTSSSSIHPYDTFFPPG